MKRLVWILPFFCMTAFAQNNSLNLQLPSGPTSFQSDKFRAGDLDCSNAIGGGTNLEFGVTGIKTTPTIRLEATTLLVNREKILACTHVS